jgi:hypothetical protein
MNSHELCPTCKPYEKCLFKELAELTAKNVPPVEQQATLADPIEQYIEVKKDTFLAHLQISHLRDIAKEEVCAIEQSVDPDYHGKKNL